MKQLMKQLLTILIFLVHFLIAPTALAAIDFPPKPIYNLYIQDYSKCLSEKTKAHIRQASAELQEKTKTHVCVVIADYPPKPIAQYAETIAHNWELGDKNPQNSIVIAIYTSIEDLSERAIYLGDNNSDLFTKSELRLLFNKSDFKDRAFERATIKAYNKVLKKSLRQTSSPAYYTRVITIYYLVPHLFLVPFNRRVFIPTPCSLVYIQRSLRIYRPFNIWQVIN